MRAVIRMATWNVAFGRRLDLVGAGLRAMRPLHLVALQELSVHDGREDAEVLARALGDGWQHHQVIAQVRAGRPQSNGLLWDSRWVGLQRFETIPLPTPEGRVMRQLPPSRRNAVVAEATFAGHTLRIYAVHLDVFGISHKHAQLGRVFEDNRARPRVDLAVIAGDMNTYGVGGRPRWSELRRMGGEAGFEELTTGVGWTHRALGVRQKLDAIMAAPPGLAHRVSRLLLPGSDHLPVRAEIELPGK